MSEICREDIPLVKKVSEREKLRAGIKTPQKISIISGKGGVGKTSIAIKMSSLLAGQGYKVLFIDCDYNLSNGVLKLGLPINEHFYSLITSKKSFQECVYREGNLHILSGCSGHLDIFETGVEFEKVLIDIMAAHEHEYDYIILDCAAGLGKDMVMLSAYCNHRFIIVAPDKSSITDSYSLIKILKLKYGIVENHLLVNKVSSMSQYRRVVKTLSETAEHFLSVRLYILGRIRYDVGSVDYFDKKLLKDADSKLHYDIFNITKRFAEEHFRSLQKKGLAL